MVEYPRHMLLDLAYKILGHLGKRLVRYRDHEYHAFLGMWLLACALHNQKRCNS